MRRDVGRHTDRDAARAIDEEIGVFRGKHSRLALALVVIRLKIDRRIIKIVEKRNGGWRETHFGIAFGRRRVAVDGAEIALPVDQGQPHREGLRHPHQRVIDREIAVRVIFAHRIAGDARRFVVGAVRHVVIFVHRKENAPVHGL